MTLRELLTKHANKVTLHSESQGIDICVDPGFVLVRESSTQRTLFRGPNQGEQQVRRFLEEYKCKTDNFSD